MTRRPVDQYLSLVGLVQPVKDVHECGLAGAVFPEQGMDFAGPEVEVHVIIGKGFSKPLADSPEFDVACHRRVPLICPSYGRVDSKAMSDVQLPPLVSGREGLSDCSVLLSDGVCSNDLEAPRGLKSLALEYACDGQRHASDRRDSELRLIEPHMLPRTLGAIPRRRTSGVVVHAVYWPSIRGFWEADRVGRAEARRPARWSPALAGLQPQRPPGFGKNEKGNP